MRADAWYGMTCWNGLSTEQRQLLIANGVLPYGRWVPEGGTCDRAASVAVETEHDQAPGPRFYCYPCAIVYVAARLRDHENAEIDR